MSSRIPTWLLIPLLAGCTPPGPPADRSDEVFVPDRLLEISIELNDQDWEDLRNQGRDLTVLAEGCRDGPTPKIYTFFPGTVTIDGITLHDVGVRKKGYLGSLLVSRPSLKLVFDQGGKRQYFMGMQRMTLNNNRQDASLARTCMAYSVFAKAGIATPRCNHARVTVNGEDLGIYSHVESIKKPFLARHFDDPAGRLYEAQRSDFRPGWVNTFENKNDFFDLERSDLDALTAALAVDDESLLDEIDPLVDVDEFMTFWAAENLLGVWDGYTNDLNNYYVYRDPDDGRFHFIPWGPDVAYTLEFALDFGSQRPRSVSAHGMLANRLYHLAGGGERYVERMRHLLDTLWQENDLLAEVDRIDTLLAPYADQDELDQIRDFIQTREAGIEAEFADGPPVWEPGLLDGDCMVTGAPVTGSFTTTWDTLDMSKPFGAGTGEIHIELDGEPQTFQMVGAQAGLDRQAGGPQPSVRIIGLREDLSALVIALFIEEGLFQSRTEVRFQGFGSFGGAIVTGQSYEFQLLGFVSAGSVTLDEASMDPESPVSGSFAGKLVTP